MYANAAGSAQFGFQGETILGEPLQTLVGDADLPVVREYLRAGSDRNEPVSSARAMRRRDGSTFTRGCRPVTSVMAGVTASCWWCAT